MLIAHASDLHGSYKKLDKVKTPDVWLITGDFFPNYGRGPNTGGLILPSYEINFQHRWWSFKMDSIMERLQGRPVIWMPGNHDFISLAGRLKVAGYSGEVYDLESGAVTLGGVGGLTFFGFREIPYIAGEWMGETRSADFEDIVSRAFAQASSALGGTDILVTHAPPAGILDFDTKYGHCGITALTNQLAYRHHRITHHFFGHVHPEGGRIKEEMGIKFINSAQTVQMIEVPMIEV